MTQPTQSYESHTRSIPLYHRFVLPVLSINLIVVIVAAVKAPTLTNWWNVVVATAIGVGIWYGRSQALRAQDRVIRNEETERLRRLLPADQQEAIAAVRPRDLVALRFASDDELPGLFGRVVTGEFKKPAEIKKAIKDWRPDHLRV